MMLPHRRHRIRSVRGHVAACKTRIDGASQLMDTLADRRLSSGWHASESHTIAHNRGRAGGVQVRLPLHRNIRNLLGLFIGYQIDQFRRHGRAMVQVPRMLMVAGDEEGLEKYALRSAGESDELGRWWGTLLASRGQLPDAMAAYEAAQDTLSQVPPHILFAVTW